MSECCNSHAAPACPSADPLAWFADMVSHSLAYAREAKAAGRPVVGLTCEFTPRELILAAGGVPALLCGGSAAMAAAAEEALPTNLCPLIKSTFGYHLRGANPFLEMADLIVAETTCDGKKKMYERMAESRPLHMLALPQRSDDAEGRAAWRREVVRLRDVLQERFGVEISPCALRAAVRTMNRERALKRALAALMQRPAPPLTGRQLLDLRAIVAGIPADLAMYEAALVQLETTPPAPGIERRTRVLLTGVPMPHGAERVLDIIEGCGGLVVASETCTGLKPVLRDVDEGAPDLLAAIADTYYHLPCSVFTPNAGRLAMLRRLASEYRPQCVIEVIWQACLTYDVESYRVRRWAEDELGVPYLRIETDYSPSDSARIAVRVEALFETARAGVPA